MKILVCQLNPIIGDFEGNSKKVKAALEKAKETGCKIALFPELTLSGYPPEDFLLHKDFIEKGDNILKELIPFTKGISCVVGTLRVEKGHLYNSAAVISNGKLLGFQDKSLLPTYDVFDEQRYFTAGEKYSLFDLDGVKVAVTICEDIWQHSGQLKEIRYKRDPIEEVKKLNPDLVLNLSASPYHFKKSFFREEVAIQAAKTLQKPFILCNQVGGNDSLIFDGYSLIVNGQGEIIARLPGFIEAMEVIELGANPVTIASVEPLEDLWKALVLGIRDYFHKSGFKQACLGLSGGIDSALVACLAVEALGKGNVFAVSMPSRFSSEGSFTDAAELAENLGISLQEIPIEGPFKSYIELLNPFFSGKGVDVTEENLQPRIRGMILMALSNKHGYIVLSTGNKSEMAMGYSTLYGDLAGGLAVLSDVTKEKVYQLSRYVNREKEIIPLSTIEKPPSAELRPNQKDSDSLPPYPIIDLVLEGYVEQNLSSQEISAKHDLSLELVEGIVKKIHQNEYKRRQSPIGLRVTEKAFTVGRRFPIVQKFL